MKVQVPLILQNIINGVQFENNLELIRMFSNKSILNMDVIKYICCNTKETKVIKFFINKLKLHPKGLGKNSEEDEQLHIIMNESIYEYVYDTFLKIRIENDDLDMVKYILSFGYKFAPEVIFSEIRSFEMYKVIYESGTLSSPVEPEKILEIAVDNYFEASDFVQLLDEFASDSITGLGRILENIVYDDRTDILSSILGKIDIKYKNEFGETLLFFVQSKEAANILISAGVDVKVRNSLGYSAEDIVPECLPAVPAKSWSSYFSSLLIPMI